MSHHELTSAKYLEQQEASREEIDQEPSQRPQFTADRMNKIIGLSVCPLALIIGVCWFFSSADGYLEDRKETREKNAKSSAAALRARLERKKIYLPHDEYVAHESRRIREFQDRKRRGR